VDDADGGSGGVVVVVVTVVQGVEESCARHVPN